MSVFDQELILPGVITDIISDYSADYDSSLFGTTDSVTIIGTAFTGPTGKPVKIHTPEHARYVFGSTFDFKTRREATLVAEIEDAWERGCRSIYAIRIGGKEIYKDFELATNSECKLRVNGIFPSNANKDVFFEFNTPDTLMEQASGKEPEVKIFKPANRATIEEKMLGRVTRGSSMLVNTIKLKSSWNMTAETRLVDFIKLFNEYRYNNVLILSIVDNDGNDITGTSLAQSLVFGDLFPGIYFIGRDKNATEVTAKTTVKSELVVDDGSMFGGKDYIAKSLECNTDVTKQYPIYSKDVSEMNKLLGGLVTMSTMFDFLDVAGKVDEVWLKDKIDYEEVGLGDFETYKKLGSGFANTAKIIEIKPNVFKVVEVTDESDPNKIAPLNDGVYSMLENLKSSYRVLAGKYADTEITAPLPNKKEFLMSNPKSGNIIDNKIKASAKVDKKDLGVPNTYTFTLEALNSDSEILDRDAIIENLFSNTIFDYPLAEEKETEFKESDKKYILLNVDGEVYVFGKVSSDMVATCGEILSGEALCGQGLLIGVENILVKPMGLLDDILGQATNVFASIIPEEEDNSYSVIIKATSLDVTTLREFIMQLNDSKILSDKFVFDFAPELSETDKNGLVSEVITGDTRSTLIDREENLLYDKSLYIPYKTTDNFARQLAQHCMYTSLKTAPTHGMIGCSKLTNTNLNGIADAVDRLVNLDLNLYVKKPNGNDMLDKNNMPYPIGRTISVTFFQTRVETGDNYSYVSSGASAYAGMVSALPINQSSTSQPIKVNSLAFELTNYQLGRLTQAGFVTVKNSYTKGYVVTDGVTMAPVTSPFRRLSVARIINTVDEAIRSAAEPFIGQQNHLANRNSLQTAIKSKLDKMLENLIERYDFKLIVDRNAERMGIIEIDYTLIPIYEIREVRNRVSVDDKK